MTENKSKSGKWSMKSHDGLHTLKLEGEGTLWLYPSELLELRELLNSLDISNEGDESIVK